MSFILFAFLSMLFWGVGDFLIQRNVKRIGSFASLFWIGVVGVIGMLPFVWDDLPMIFSNIWFLLFLGCIVFISAIFNFEALRKGKLSVVEVILEFELSLTIVLGVSLFHESLSILQTGIIVSLFAGILLIAVGDFSHFRNIRWEKGVALTIITAIGFGFVNFFTAHISREVSPLIAIWFPWLIFTVVCFFILARERKFNFLVRDFSKNKIIVLFMGLFDTLAWIFYAFAVLDGDIGITTAITESYPVIAITLAFFINRERIKKHQWLGAVIALCASVLLAVSV